MATETVATGAAARISPRRRAVVEFVLDNLVWFILIVLLAVFSAAIPQFLQTGILLNILEQSTFVGIIAVGLSLTLLAGQMDLSIESVMALSAMVVALTLVLSTSFLLLLALPLTSQIQVMLLTLSVYKN